MMVSRQGRKKKPLYTDVIVAGFGGQGILLAGNLLAYAGMHCGLHVTFIPVYGAEMRGGTANCTVVLSTDEIGSPLVRQPHAVIAMNAPSYAKFSPAIQPNGFCIVNSSLVSDDQLDKSLWNISIDMAGLAQKAGDARLANMAALGAYVGVTQLFPLKAVQESLHEIISAHYTHLIPYNEKALTLGYAVAVNQ